MIMETIKTDPILAPVQGFVQTVGAQQDGDRLKKQRSTVLGSVP